MIALIAHDAQKTTLLKFVRGHVEYFKAQQLVATGNTDKMLHDELGLG